MNHTTHPFRRIVCHCTAFAIAALCALCALLALPLTAGASGEPGMRGDVTRDGELDIQDYLLLKRYLLGTYSMNSAQKLCADVNGDYTVDEQDSLLLKRILLGTYTLPQTGNGTGGEAPGNDAADNAAGNGSNGTQTPPAGESGSSNQTAQTGSEAQEILRLVNEQRTQNGLAPLTLSDKLCELATLKAEDMVANGYFDHISPTYGTPFEMMKQFGVSYRSAGENIAAGQRTPEEVMNAWMNSSGHRANILNETYTELGVGVAVGSRGIHWVQLFCKP